MKIIFLTTGLLMGGAEMVLYRLLSRLNRERFSPAVISLREKGPLQDRIAELGVPVYPLGMQPGLSGALRGMTLMARLRSLVRTQEPNLIHGWMYHGNLAASFARAQMKRKVPVLWSIHNSIYRFDLEKRGTAAVIRAGALLSKYVDRIVYCASVTAAQHEDLGYVADKSVVVPNGFDITSLKRVPGARADVCDELHINHSAKLVGMFGRFHAHKDFPGFLKAAARVARDLRQVHFLLAGPGVEEQNEQLRKYLDHPLLCGRVHLLGARSDVPRLMSALDLLVSASVSESFPLVVGEAMAMGTPCVVTEVGDSKAMVEGSGIAVPPSNPEALAGAVVAMLEECPSEREARGARARERVVEYYSLERMVQQYERLYRESVARSVGMKLAA